MPTTETSKATRLDPTGPSAKNTPRDTENDTGERDENYDLISVLYHALQAAESCAKYWEDAKAKGDIQLAQFFEEARGGHVELALQAKLLLVTRLDPSRADDEV